MYGHIIKAILLLICTSQVKPASINQGDDVITPCGSCTCWDKRASADCSFKNLKSIPLDLPSNFTDFNLSNNKINISNLNEVALCQKYPGLKKVSLAWNGLTTLNHTLQGCTHLQHLDLTGNVLELSSPLAFKDLQILQELVSLEAEELHPAIFQNLKRLETLQLTFHGIMIQPGVFSGLKSMKKLTLTLEKVLALPEKLFSFTGGTVLKSLTLNGLKVKNIPEDLLDELTSLEELHLDLPQMLELKLKKDRKPKDLQVLEISNLKNLAEDILSGLDNLDTVKLYGISNLQGDNLLKVALTVKELEIVKCSMTELPAGWLNNMAALETLNLSENGLERLNPHDFMHLKSLKHLILSNNKIQSIPAGLLDPLKATLQQLILSNNQIKELWFEVFADLMMLEILDLKHNTIRNIAATSFTNLTNLKNLQLSENYISSLENVSFESFPKLEIIDLAENMISTFPETLLKSNVVKLYLSANNLQNLPGKKLCAMKNIDYLGLEDNPLLCDCSVRGLHMCLPGLIINGKCSQPMDLEGQNNEEVTECTFTPLSGDLLTTPSLIAPASSELVSSLLTPSGVMLDPSQPTTNQVLPIDLSPSPALQASSGHMIINSSLRSDSNPMLSLSVHVPNLIPSSVSFTTNLIPSSLISTTNLIPSSESFSTNLIPSSVTFTTNLIPSSESFSTNLKPSSSSITANLMPSSESFSTNLKPSSSSITANLMPSSESFTANLMTSPHASLIASPQVSPTSSSDFSLSVLYRPIKDLDDKDGGEEIVREIVAEGFELSLELSSSSNIEHFVSSQSVDPIFLVPIYENISEKDGAVNESETMKNNEGTSLPTNRVSVSAVPVKAREGEDDKHLNQATDIVIAIFVSLAVLASFMAGVWFYRKYSRQGSYNADTTFREQPPGDIIQMESVMSHQSSGSRKK